MSEEKENIKKLQGKISWMLSEYLYKNSEGNILVYETAHNIALFVNARDKRREELIDALEDYQKLLVAELDDLVVLAHVHGWRSKRIEEGRQAREKIKELKDRIGKEKNENK